ncbi:MAG: ABC transporter permease [Vicinamibacterales bacterium]
MGVDLRHAVRLLIKSPSFTAIAVGTLAIGIAANAAIFSVVDALLLRPLPYPEPDQLVMLWQDQRARGGPENEWLAPAHFFDWRNRSRSLEASAVFRGASPALTGAGEPEQLRGWQVSHEFFRTLGVAPVLGRDFSAADDAPGAPGTAVLTHGLWTRRFGADPAVIGRTIALNREPYTVIGVLPPSFRSPFDRPEIFRPLRMNAARPSRGAIVLQMLARLEPQVSLERAQAELTTIGAALAAEYPETDKGSTIRVTRLHDEIVGDVRTPLVALFGAVALVLMIACANIASLQLARASVRWREMAVRTALGASRARIVRQLLMESVVLAALGSLAGLLLSSWMLDSLLALAPDGTPRLDEARINVAVLVFGTTIAVATSLVFGLVPALHGVRGDVAAAIKEGSKGGGASRAGVTARSLFVVAELALALMLLVGAGLLMRSLANIRAVDPGFTPDRLLAGIVSLPAHGYEKPVQIKAFYRALVERLESIPGVRAAAVVNVLPFSGEDTDTGFVIEGRPAPTDPADRPTAWYRVVSPGYLRTAGMRLEAGRFIEPGDRESAEGVVVVNRTLANRYWPGEDPLGKRISNGDRVFTIVGIAGDVRHRGLREDPRGQMFLSYQQVDDRRMTLVLKTAGEPAGVLPAVREHLAALDPSLPLFNVTTVEALLADLLALPRFMTLLMGAFAGVALLLAAIGIYGLMAYTVALRTQELGIRMALGAAAGDVLRLVLGDAARVTAAGVIVGALAAFGAARFIRALLFGVTASDLPTFALTALVLGAIALLASYLPARKAVRVDPVAALRDG